MIQIKEILKKVGKFMRKTFVLWFIGLLIIASQFSVLGAALLGSAFLLIQSYLIYRHRLFFKNMFDTFQIGLVGNTFKNLRKSKNKPALILVTSVKDIPTEDIVPMFQDKYRKQRGEYIETETKETTVPFTTKNGDKVSFKAIQVKEKNGKDTKDN